MTPSLTHFVTAQDTVWPQVVDELTAGRKRTHWMWFVFPQLRALGRSETARRYGIESLAEAHAYLAHPLLGPRLAECTRLVVEIEGRTLHDIFGTPDDMKFRSCMTLFAAASADGSPYRQALARYCGDVPDPLTLERLGLPR